LSSRFADSRQFDSSQAWPPLAVEGQDQFLERDELEFKDSSKYENIKICNLHPALVTALRL